MRNWTPKEFCDHIDAKFLEAKRQKLSRMSVEWGKWSREMNLILRERMESKVDSDELKLKYVMVYWTLISQLLELYFQGSLLRAWKIKRRRKEAEELKSIILTGKGLKELKLDVELAKRMLG